MQRFKTCVLPAAIVLGLIFHKYCALFSFLVPYIIFCILLLTFCAVDLTKLRFRPLYTWIILFQTVVSIGGYMAMRAMGIDPIIAEGVLIGVLCPVASSVAVISCMLGADRETVTTFTIIGNLFVAIVAPAVFTAIGVHPEYTILISFGKILGRIAPTLALPFFIALILQKWSPGIKDYIGKRSSIGFYLWCFALLFTLGQTIDFIYLHGEGNWSSIIWLASLSLIFCIIQFGLGKWIGHKYGDTISGGQLLGQKNTAMGIWMANHFLHPLSAVFLAFYSIFQNLFNTIQLYLFEQKHKT